MNYEAVVTELETALKTIPELRVLPFRADSINPPQVVIPLPERIELEKAYQRGMAQLELQVLLLLGQVSDRTVPTRFSDYISPGEKSIKEAIEDRSERQAFDEAVVTEVTFDTVSVGSIVYAAALFTVIVVGQGRT